MNKSRSLAVLMGVAILGITGFQLYWLKQNYAREKKTLTIKTEMAFRETVMQLQVAKLNLEGTVWDTKDSGVHKTKIMMHDKKGGQVNLRFRPKEEIFSTINVIRAKLKDSLKAKPESKPAMITISMNQTSEDKDAARLYQYTTSDSGKGDRIYNLLYGVDSLQEPLRLTEIDSAYANALQEEKLTIPFSIIQTDSADNSDEPEFNKVTVGLAKPITYQLKLGNTFPFLIKQIRQPILFSILLLGITILSFVLLYRSLLRQRRLAELKNEFISNITHELKTPIATVGVAIEALKNFNAIDNPERTKEYLDISQNELQRLSLLVDKVLKLSMFEKKEIELRYEPLNLKDIADEVAASMRLQLEKYKATLSVTQEGNPVMQGDKLHLQSVVFNLLDNALKYSKENPAIQIHLQEETDALKMIVTDNGIGIAPEYKNKVFDKFFRIPHGDTHNAKGYGLGLSYVAHVVQKHKGNITVESQPGAGTRFIITFPKQTV